MEISGHIKTQWAIRGDYNREAKEAWDSGVCVRLPNYDYGRAKLDERSGTILLSRGGCVTTAITEFEHMEIIPLDDVTCSDCETEYSRNPVCPGCGSSSWSQS